MNKLASILLLTLVLTSCQQQGVTDSYLEEKQLCSEYKDEFNIDELFPEIISEEYSSFTFDYGLHYSPKVDSCVYIYLTTDYSGGFTFKNYYIRDVFNDSTHYHLSSCDYEGCGSEVDIDKSADEFNSILEEYVPNFAY